MFRAALSYPTRKPNGRRSVLVGGVVVLVVSLFGLTSALEQPVTYAALLGVLPWLLIRGYYVRVVRTTIGRERPTPPPFDDLGALFRDGLASLVISGLYLLPAVVVLGPLAVARAVDRDPATLFAEMGLPSAVANAAVSVIGVLATFAFMYLIGALYATPMAVARYAHTGRFRAAFGVRRIVGGTLTEDYVVAWVISLLLQVLVLPFAYALRVVLVGFFLHFVAGAAVRYCYGQGVGAALDLDPVAADWMDADSGPAGPPGESPPSAVTRVESDDGLGRQR